MSPRTKITLAIGAATSLGVAAWLTFSALPDGLSYYVTPSKVGVGETAQGGSMRVGGTVKPGSLNRVAKGETPHFILQDDLGEVAVRVTVPLPEMLREGQTAVAEGRIEARTLVAHRVIPLFDDPLKTSSTEASRK